MESVMRCKMWVTSVLHSKEADGTTSEEKVTLAAVYSSDPATENARWSKWTPSANLTIHISNPEAFGKLSAGHEFFVDFTPAG